MLCHVMGCLRAGNPIPQGPRYLQRQPRDKMLLCGWCRRKCTCLVIHHRKQVSKVLHFSLLGRCRQLRCL